MCFERTEIEVFNLGVSVIARNFVDEGQDFVEEGVVVGADLDHEAEDCDRFIFVGLLAHEKLCVRGVWNYVPVSTCTKCTSPG